MADTRTPQEIDTELVELHLTAERARGLLTSALNEIHRLAKDRKQYTGRHAWRWCLTDAQVITTVRERVSAGDDFLAQGAKSLERLATGRTDLDAITEQIASLDKIYRAAPWPRYFPCLNTDGHIHRSLHCQTLHPTTRMAWTPALSGKPIDVAVAEMGEALCTVCYPDAPSDWKAKTLGQVRDERTAAERATAKAQREAAKAAKELTPSEQFRDHRNDRVTTVAACKQVLRDTVADRYWYPKYYAKNEHRYTEAAQRARSVLLARGVPAEELDTIVGRAEQKARKDSGK